MAGLGSPLSPGGSGTDVSDKLGRIEQNTKDLVRWMKYLVVAVFLLIIVTALLFV